MAGLWELVKEDAVDRLSTHFVVGAMKGRQANIANAAVGFTAAQILTALNAMRTAEGKPVLTAAEETDLTGINTTLTNQGTVAARESDGNLGEAVLSAAEMGQVSETKWRGDLGI